MKGEFFMSKKKVGIRRLLEIAGNKKGYLI
jgi:hypothetical protein